MFVQYIDVLITPEYLLKTFQMKKNSKKRLFEIMSRLDKTFKSRLNENQNFFDDEPSIIDKYYKTKIPQVIKASHMTNVLLNPKNLKDVETGVRVIGDIKGNLYVAEKDGEFTHNNLGDDLGFDIWDNPNYIRLVRGRGNNFYLSDGLTEDDYHKVLDALRKAHPRFKFHNEVFRYIKHMGYNQ